LLCGIRPEALLQPERDGRGAAARFRGVVELREQLGSEVHVHLTVPGAPPALGGFVDDAAAADRVAVDPGGLVIARLPPRARAKEGETIELDVDADGVQFFDPATGARVDVW
jgi:ABC-type sugar transport system ATPase subunit